MSEDIRNWGDWLVGETPGTAAHVRTRQALVDPPDVLPSNAPYGSPWSGRRTIPLWVSMGDSDSSPACIASVSQVDALFALCPQRHSAPGLAVQHVLSSPRFLPAVAPVLAEFSEGLGDLCPTPDAVRLAEVLSHAALQHVRHPDITVDVDGELSFDLRLKDGRLVFAELGLDGRLDVGVYGLDDQMLDHDADATVDYFLSVIKS